MFNLINSSTIHYSIYRIIFEIFNYNNVQSRITMFNQSIMRECSIIGDILLFSLVKLPSSHPQLGAVLCVCERQWDREIERETQTDIKMNSSRSRSTRSTRRRREREWPEGPFERKGTRHFHASYKHSREN